MIQVHELRKVFKSPKIEPGFGGAVKSLFNRQYDEKVAVDGISFSIAPGEIVGYLGPNGAGKSTTIKMVTGILTPTSGSCSVDGRVPYEERIENARNIGVVFGQRTQLWWDLPPDRDLLDPPQDVPRAAICLGCPAQAAPRGARPRRVHGPARPYPLARPAHEGRPRRRDGPFPEGPVPRRADDRTRHRRQGPDPAGHQGLPRRERDDRHAHHPRHGRHRGTSARASSSSTRGA